VTRVTPLQQVAGETKVDGLMMNRVGKPIFLSTSVISTLYQY